MRVKLPPSPFHLNMHSVVLDQNSTILPENHSAMTLDEKIESARKKKEEGDHIFTSGNFLRAYRRYFKASQILRSCSPDPDSEIKQMLICMALSGAKCAMQLQRFKQASDCIHEVPLYTCFSLLLSFSPNIKCLR